MNFDWAKLPVATYGTLESPRRIEYILIEYDGAELATFVDDSGVRYLGLLADESELVQRWLHARIRKMELEALARGALSMKSVFMGRDLVDVVDVKHSGEVVGVQSVSPEILSADVLPIPGAALPAFAQQELLKHFPVAAPVQKLFRYDGPKMVSDVVSLSVLGSVSQVLQNLWTGLAAMLFPNQGEATGNLFAEYELRNASLGLVVRGENEDVFIKIAERFSRLLGLAEVGGEAFKQEYDSLPIVVRLPLRHYLAALGEQKLDSLTDLPTGTKYLGHEAAQRSAKAMRTRTQIGPEEAHSSVFITTGHFEAFNLKSGRFVLEGARTGRISGKITREVKEDLRPKGKTKAIGVSFFELWEVELRATERSGEVRYELLSAKRKEQIV